MALSLVNVAAPTALRNLPPFPPAAERLLRVLGDESVSLGEAARVMRTDAALSAEVLRLANSPLGSRFGARTVLDAISLLGLPRVRGLVLTLAMSCLLRGRKQNAFVRRCWRHNLASALVAKHFAEGFDYDLDEAYMAGLMHDIGRLALFAANPAEYAAISLECRDTRPAEREIFGIDHCEAGAWLVARWCLPASLEQVAMRHHAALSEADPLTNIIHVSCQVASEIGFQVAGQPSDATEPVLPDAVAEHIAASVNAVELEFGL